MGPLTPSAILLQSLQNPALFDHQVQEFQIIETHISWVLLTGPYAYKMKKPVDLGFVNFSTLERRHHFCHEELRLNRRLAPEVYLEVLAITGTPEKPGFDRTKPAIEYAVKMKQFPQENLLSQVLEQEQLSIEHLDSLAKQMADFHRCIQVAGTHTAFGTPDTLIKPVQANFEYLPSEAHHMLETGRLEAIQAWSEQEHASRRECFIQRKAEGYIRECHGDLHLGNMALIHDRIVIFDCIEFSDQLRWIDVMCEVAFVVMDLIDRNHSDLAYRLLNVYLEHTGDYVGLSVFRYYLVYRAMVRTKVAGIRLKQEDAGDQKRVHSIKELKSYLSLAERLTQPRPPALIIMHGFSGSGKTMISQMILEFIEAVRIRSDVERKRLFGLSSETRTADESRSAIYGTDATQLTYSRLGELAGEILDAGFTVVVDATFLEHIQRLRFKNVAERKQVPFLILDVAASDEMLMERVKHREERGADASEATLKVLEHQLVHHEPFTTTEQPYVLQIMNDQTFKSAHVLEEVLKRLQVT